MAKKISIVMTVLFCCVFVPPSALSADEVLLPLIIEQGDNQVRLDVEFAKNPDDRARGLMHRETLPALGGMLFDFGDQKSVTMWMKNTLISLDMIFANDQGVVHFIKRNAVPGDLDIITSPYPTRYVLEVNAGFVKTHNVQIGNRLVYTSQRN